MSHLGTRFLNMMSSAEVLRGTLSLYNWREDELNNRRLDAILAVSHHRIQRFEQGFLLRGLDIEVTLDGSGFTGAGDVHLFGDMLNRFFALYADMNQFNQLTLIVQPEGNVSGGRESQSAPARLMAQLRPQLPYMNFYRFCQLLEKNHPKAPIIGSGWLVGDEPIRFRPHPGMGFPAGEIRGMDDPEPPRSPAVRVTLWDSTAWNPRCRPTIAMTLRNGGKASRPPRISSISLTIG